MAPDTKPGHCKWCGLMLDASLDEATHHRDLRTCLHVMSLSLAAAKATAIRRRVVLGRVEWSGRLYVDDPDGTHRCPECGARKPDHDKSCSLKAELGNQP